MAIQSGQRTSENATSRPKAKAKSSARTKPTKKSKAKRAPAKKKGKATPILQHSFPAGAKVTVHPAHENEFNRSEGVAPGGKSLASASVAKDGTLGFTGLKTGYYVAACEVEDEAPVDTNSPNAQPATNKRYLYVLFTVKDTDQINAERTKASGGLKAV